MSPSARPVPVFGFPSGKRRMCNIVLTIGESLRRRYTAVELRRAVCRIAPSSELTTARLSEVLREDDPDWERSEPPAQVNAVLTPINLTWMTASSHRSRDEARSEGAPSESTLRRGLDHSRRPL